MTTQQFKQLEIGDQVLLKVDTKDAYGEVWDNAGDIVIIKKFTEDGLGVIFEWSDLGVSYKKISRMKMDKKEKSGLRTNVINSVQSGQSDSEIIKQLAGLGFSRATVKKYIKDFRTLKSKVK